MVDIILPDPLALCTRGGRKTPRLIQLPAADPELQIVSDFHATMLHFLVPGYGLAFLREYGVNDADEERVEALRLRYELG